MTYDSIIELIEDSAKKLNCEVVRNAELKNYTTFKIGGTCDLLVEINSAHACKKLIQIAKSHDIKYYVIGKGSNLIVDDNGVSGIVLHLGNSFVDFKCNDVIITADAGLSLNKLCLTALENNLTGLEFAYGIPGTVGGALYMNAGAYGGEIKDVIVSAEVLDTDGNIRTISAESMELSYRSSIFMHNNMVILSVTLKLTEGNKDEIKARMDELMNKRRTSQPLEYGSAGSTFKRPEGSYASLLIDQCGLKGMSVGDAEVSTKHAGFVVNKGNASFDDLMQLISDIKKIVYEKTGYALECEPEIISEREEYR